MTDNALAFRQLRPNEKLAPDDISQIAELIFDTDPYIYPCLFGDSGICADILERTVREGTDAMFRLENLFVAEESNRIIGLILWEKGHLLWDSNTIEHAFEELHLPLPEGFEKVCQEYFASYAATPSDQVNVLNVCVEKGHRYARIGSQMLSAFIDLHEKEVMELCVLECNLPAISLYRKAGFEVIGTTNGFSIDSHELPCLVMKRPSLSV